MKGPYERLKYELRRVFECPKCQRRVKVPGSVTSVTCTCPLHDGKPSILRLAEDGVRRMDSFPISGQAAKSIAAAPNDSTGDPYPRPTTGCETG